MIAPCCYRPRTRMRWTQMTMRCLSWTIMMVRAQACWGRQLIDFARQHVSVNMRVGLTASVYRRASSCVAAHHWPYLASLLRPRRERLRPQWRCLLWKLILCDRLCSAS